MIKFDFKTDTEEFINQEEYAKLYSEKKEWLEKLSKCEMTGWMKEVDSDTIQKIKTTAEKIKQQFDCLVVIGIGGSFLGSYAFHKSFQKYFSDDSFELIYAGTTLSDEYLEELVEYLENKNFCINVISKSGTTMETSVTYHILKDLLKRKYSQEELRKHIIVTTDKEKGKLREEVMEENYLSFEIPEDIGGRYSFITPAHLLPLAINYNIDEIIDGYYDGKRYLEEAFEYAVTRKLLFDQGKYVENYCIYEEKLSAFTEWLKQLFGETEGKNGVGIYPTSSVHTRDLHSLGQFIQEGNKVIFETFIKIEKSSNYILYKGKNLHEMNNLVLDSVVRAHHSGGVPCIEITMDKLTEKNVSSLIYFFLLSASLSGLLFGVDPFNQPGVEVYKKEVKKSIGEL
ncbi:MAG: glucose-6-phosphate isomerase [Bacilli bacterium]|nr:glucose-6-phosphate isomerase [Bacilli bacterium]